MPDAAAVAPVVISSSVVAAYEGVTHTVGSLVGSSPSYLAINTETASVGTLMTDSDFTSGTAVADIGATVAQDLFGGDGSAAVNKTIQLGGKDFSVQGVLTAKGSSGIQDQDDTLLAPLTSVQDELTGLGGSLSNITVQATATDTVDAVQSEIENVLDSRHQARPAATTTSRSALPEVEQVVASVREPGPAPRRGPPALARGQGRPHPRHPPQPILPDRPSSVSSSRSVGTPSWCRTWAANRSPSA